MSDQHVGVVSDAPVKDLAASLSGGLVEPDGEGYDEARQVFNAGIDRRPAAIVGVADVSDVALAVSFAREHGLELAVRGGGHGFAGHGVSEGGLVLDMSALRGLEIDAEARTAWAGAGLTAGEYTAAVGQHGLATGFGDTGGVGIAGITLGGGIGLLVRKHGLTIDSLLAVELVTADGELREVDAERDPDLFWALRGGGGNFGVVTRLRYRLQEVDAAVGGMLILPASADVVRGFLTYAEEASEDFSAIANLAPVPPMPAIPAEHHGSVALMAMLVHAGDPEAGREALAPLRGLATPILDGLRELRYRDVYEGEGGPPRATVAMRTGFRDEIGDDDIDAMLERVAAPADHMRVVQLRPLGGAMARVPADATAFAHRDRRLMVVAGAMAQGPTDLSALAAWAGDTASALRLPGGGAYVNYLGDDGPERIREAYPGGTYDRLAEVKRRYDPDNLFRLNQNVAPAG